MAASPNSTFNPFAEMKYDNTLGVMLIGLVVSTTLFGLISLQTYLYYVNYPKDRTTQKWLVGALWVLNVVQTAFICHATYFYLVINYGKPASLLGGEWSIIMEVAASILVSMLVQLFFAHRVYKVSNNYWLAGIIAMLALGHTSTGIAAVVKLFQIKIFARITEAMGIMTTTLIIMAGNDVFITLVLCWYLRKAKSSFQETNSAIKTLLIYTIETGLLTSLTVTVDAVCILTMPHNWIFIGITFCISKLYANSLLTILNSRKLARGDGTSTQKLSAQLSGIMVHSIRMQDFSPASADSSPISPNSLQTIKFEVPRFGTGIPQGLPPESDSYKSPRTEMGYAV